MTRTILAGAVAAAALVLAPGAVAVAATPTAPASAQAVIAKSPPRHDPHCTRDGRWHNTPQDHPGHPDPRCPRW
jgi:Spy/CpxP family protein refolding chaperone